VDEPVIVPSVFALALAALIGVSLGVLGSGGSIVTLPVLVYIAHVPAKEAVGMSMAIVGATSLFGAFIHWRRGNVDTRAALIFSLFGMAGAFLGSTGTHLLSKKALLLLFSGVMLIVGSLMLRGGPRLDKYRVCYIPRCMLVGFVVGLLTGFLGVGGGFLIVPALMLTAGLDTRMAGGTSLAVIALNAATGLLGQLRYVSIDWTLLAGFLVFAFAGMLAGLAFARRLPENLVRRLFAIALIALALVIALLNF
jgi:uncharacterized membrane protein YfcA